MAYYGSNDFVSSEHDDEEYQVTQPQKEKRKSAAGRKLVRWNPDLDQLVLLCVDYVAVKNNIPIPWDEVASLINDYMTGEAIKQHLAKIYKYREADNHQVPPRLERNQRRMANKPSTGSTSSGAGGTVRGRGSKKSGAGAAAEATPEPVKPGASLLFKPPQKTKTPKRSANTPNTPAAPGRSRKNIKHIKIEDDDSDDEYGARKSKAGSRGGKRGRATRREEDDLVAMSPSKKPKTSNYLRPTTAVNYAEQMATEKDEEVDGTYHEESPTGIPANQPNGLPHSMSHNSIYSQPPPQFAYPTAHNTPQHGHSAVPTPLNTHGTTSPYDASPHLGHSYAFNAGLSLVNHYRGMPMQRGLMNGNSTAGMVHGFDGMNTNTNNDGLGVHGIAALDGNDDPYIHHDTSLANANMHGHRGQGSVAATIETQNRSPSHDQQPASFNLLQHNSGGFAPPPQPLEHHGSPVKMPPSFVPNGFQSHEQNEGNYHALLPHQSDGGFNGVYGEDKFDLMPGAGHGLGEAGDMAGHASFIDDIFNHASAYDDNALLAGI